MQELLSHSGDRLVKKNLVKVFQKALDILMTAADSGVGSHVVVRLCEPQKTPPKLLARRPSVDAKTGMKELAQPDTIPRWRTGMEVRSLQQISREGFRRYLSNTGWLMAERVLRLGVGLLVGVYVARYLGPGRFGSLSYAQGMVAILAAVASLGLDNVLVRELVRRPEQSGGLLGTALILRLAGAIIAIALITVVASSIDMSDTERWLVIIISFGLLCQSGTVLDAWFQSQVQGRSLAGAHAAQVGASSLAKVGLVLAGAPLIWFAFTAVLDSAVLAMALFRNYRRQNPTHPVAGWCFDSALAKSLMRRSWPLIFSGLALAVYMKIDQVMIRDMLGAAEVGQYAAAVRISEAWLVLAVVLTTSLYPAVIAARERSEAAFRSRLNVFYSLMFWLSLAVAAPLALLSEPIIQLLYGEVFAAAGPVLRIHAWAGVMVFLITASSRWYLAQGMERSILWRALFGAVSNVALNLYLIPSHGIEGAALATLLSYGAMALLYDLLDPRGRVSFYLKLSAVVLPFRLLFSRLARSSLEI